MLSHSMPLQGGLVLCNLDAKNARAQQIIRDFAAKHAAMDIGIGLISLLPGAGIPALIGAFAAQGAIIYRPMAQELAKVYLTNTTDYTDKLANVGAAATVAMEFAQEFATEFLMEVISELFMEIGLGAAATMLPFAGAVIAGTLDYLVANMMTWRVGTMTAIYFQNGGSWINDRKGTFEIAKDLTGGLHVGLTALISGSAKSKTIRVDLSDIPRKVPSVLRATAENILPIVKGLASKMPREAVVSCLLGMGIPALIAEAGVHLYYSTI